jgi:hypothetical protein
MNTKLGLGFFILLLAGSCLAAITSLDQLTNYENNLCRVWDQTTNYTLSNVSSSGTHTTYGTFESCYDTCTMNSSFETDTEFFNNTNVGEPIVPGQNIDVIISAYLPACINGHSIFTANIGLYDDKGRLVVEKRGIYAKQGESDYVVEVMPVVIPTPAAPTKYLMMKPYGMGASIHHNNWISDCKFPHGSNRGDAFEICIKKKIVEDNMEAAFPLTEAEFPHGVDSPSSIISTSKIYIHPDRFSALHNEMQQGGRCDSSDKCTASAGYPQAFPTAGFDSLAVDGRELAMCMYNWEGCMIDNYECLCCNKGSEGKYGLSTISSIPEPYPVYYFWPDLAIENFGIDKQAARAGDTVTISATIRNLNEYTPVHDNGIEKDPQLALYIDGEPVWTGTIHVPETTQEAKFSYEWTVPLVSGKAQALSPARDAKQANFGYEWTIPVASEGTHTISLTVDPSGEITETDETYNSNTAEVEVAIEEPYNVLRINSISIAPSFVVEKDSSIDVDVNVENLVSPTVVGATVELKLLDDADNVLWEQTSPSYGTVDSTVFSFTGIPLAGLDEGSYTLRATAVADIQEDVLADNAKQAYFSIVERRALSVPEIPPWIVPLVGLLVVLLARLKAGSREKA